jgi:OmpA-OmpF porin, OOP family
MKPFKKTIFVILWCYLVVNLFPNVIVYSQSIDSNFQQKCVIKLLDQSINTEYDDFAPVYIKDNNLFIFTSDRKDNSGNFKRQNLLYSKIIDTSFTKTFFLDSPLNDKYNEGCFTYSSKTNTIYFSRQVGHNTDIYRIKATLSSAGVTILGMPEKCPIINSSNWDSEPSISQDGETLYFASDRPGGFGGSDIWFSRLDNNGNLSEPQNLGIVINTRRNEFAPFISFNDSTLFFSSDGHSNNIGGLDFYSSSFHDSIWSIPENLSFLNSADDDLFLFMVDSSTIYFSSNRNSGDYNIYSAIIPKSIEIEKKNSYSTYQALVFDIKNNLPIKDFSINILNKDLLAIADNKILKSKPNSFLALLPCDSIYKIIISAPDYLNYTEKITTSICGNIITKKILLYPIGWVFTLNISFPDTSTILEKNSIPGLDFAYNILNDNPEIAAEIAVHTDRSMEWSKGILLTRLRAESIKNYLIERGISPERLKSKGYGPLEIVSPDSLLNGTRSDQRVELKIYRR